MFPTLSPEMQSLIRVSYGVLQLLTLVSALPHARRYFRSERWGGYAQSSRAVDAVQNPTVSSALLGLWLVSVVAVIAGRAVVAAAAVNLVLCYYFFIRMRWRGALRGMGAPGFMSFWLSAAVFLLELTTRYAPDLRGLALLTLQVDFALIMISAGLYKMAAGYRASSGMELGMVNPEWGYWPTFWGARPPGHPVFRFLNEMAWSTEVFAGILMLIPATRMVGAIAIMLSFVFIASQIRLGFLCEMVIISCLLFLPGSGAVLPGATQIPMVVQEALTLFLWTYIALLPIVRAGMFYNQLAHQSLPAVVQRALDTYTNCFGLIIWRVFTADVVNFFVRIWEEPSTGGAKRLVSDYEGFPGTHRFRQVAECIAVTSVFTTLKYYPSNRPLFVERLVRYARTVPHAEASRLVFEWVTINKRADRFEFFPIAEYRVDTKAGVVDESILSDRISVTAPAVASPVHEGSRPGSYAPLNPRT